MKTKENKPSEFKQLVLKAVSEIPKGEVKTYGEIAEIAGNRNASRAVARIMSQNYNPLIPCHRVIRSDGRLGGYNRGGELKKRKILESEGVKI